MTVGIHIYKIALNHGRSYVQNPSTNHRQSASLLQLFVKHYTSSATLPVASSTRKEPSRKEPSFAESYLVDTFGFTPQSALTASRYVRFKTADKPESVLSCFREFGLSETQLSLLVRRCPGLLSLNTEKKLSPKLEFFLSKGLSRTELARLLSTDPFILTIGLENHMVPFYDFFRSVLKSDEKVSRMCVHSPHIIKCRGCYMMANIDHLRHNRVPETKIATLVQNRPQAFAVNSERFNEIVVFVKEKGLNPSNVSFVQAVATVASMSRQTWEKKVRLYESWGWSKEDVIVAFKKFPQFMTKSETKINAVMNLLINNVGCETVYIAQHPIIFSFSLEKRIIPRCSVIKVLVSKGMIKLTSLSSMLKISDDLFEKKLLNGYGEEAPNLLTLYRQKMNVPK